MRAFEFLTEKIVHRSPPSYKGDWMHTVIAINPSKSEFWSTNFRQGQNGPTETPSAAGVILTDGTVVVGAGHVLDHETICQLAGLDIGNEWLRLQIHGNKVVGEVWLAEEWENGEIKHQTKEDVIAAVEAQYNMTIEQIKQRMSQVTSRFVPGWQPVLSIWSEHHMESFEL